MRFEFPPNAFSQRNPPYGKYIPCSDPPDMIPTAASDDTPRRRSSFPTDMASQVFSERITVLPTHLNAALSTEFDISDGRIPNRQKLRELSASLGISQARIRRWYCEKGEEEEKNRMNARVTMMKACKKNKLLDDLYELLDENDEILKNIKF